MTTIAEHPADAHAIAALYRRQTDALRRVGDPAVAVIDGLVAERNATRAAGDYAVSDAIRAVLTASAVVVADDYAATGEPSRWYFDFPRLKFSPPLGVMRRPI